MISSGKARDFKFAVKIDRSKSQPTDGIHYRGVVRVTCPILKFKLYMLSTERHNVVIALTVVRQCRVKLHAAVDHVYRPCPSARTSSDLMVCAADLTDNANEATLFVVIGLILLAGSH